MKRFMQIALASFGVLALMLAGCNSATTEPKSTDEGTTVEGTTTTTTTDDVVAPTTDTTATDEKAE